MSELKYHLFGIVNKNETKVHDSRIQLLNYKDLEAALCPACFNEADLFDKNKLVSLLKDYQEILENLRPGKTVLPVQLSALSFNELEIEKILSDYYDPVYSLIRELKGKEEFEIQIRWNNLQQVLKQIGEGQEFVSALQSRLNEQKGMSIQVENQLYAGKLLACALEEKRKKITEETITALGPYTSNFKTLPIIDESLAAHISFLIDSTKEEAFYGELDKFSEAGEYGEILKFRSIGPLVPYSFATISLTYLNSADIENYVSLLKLSNDTLSEKELKTKIRELSLIYHPDKDKNNEEVFKKMIGAYKLLSGLVNMEEAKSIELSKYKDRYVLTVPGISQELALV